MKKVLLISLLLLAGCTSKTEYGPCIGAFDDRNPKLEYKMSFNNLVVGALFFELILPPISVVVNETFCPIGVKQ